MTRELQIDIQNKSFQMFRDWTANARKLYPEYDYTIIDETILGNDLSCAIQSAVDSLKKEDKASKRGIPNYDAGFMLGFIQSNLNGQWVHEYIHKRSDDYKMLKTLQALQLYLGLENIALIKIEEIYKRLILNDLNFETIDFKPDKNSFSDFGLHVEINGTPIRENNISISLDSMIAEKIVKITNHKDPDFLPETDNYFSENEILDLISSFG